MCAGEPARGPRESGRREDRRGAVRRGVVLGLASAGLAAVTHPRLAAAAGPARRLSLLHLCTGEALDATYFAEGRYRPEALAAAARLLRDWRTGEPTRSRRPCSTCCGRCARGSTARRRSG